ncbi:MAG: hypothetical protein B7Z35_07175 [Hydrogenophilales bacterium 12-61-10]|nr:MAG: hypothetical protein B7Z35_07175 [Hydrogenophilales bacterium 12-61-10]OYX32524.1 MAG: hypothetical protein B7Z03_01635 [Hydrogenophilales bacterium 32-62-9]
MNSLAAKFASGIARLTPFSKGESDPTSSVKAATRWIATLPIGDAFKCQQSILSELKRLNENSSQFTKDRLAVLMLLDEKAQDLQDTLVRQYLRNPRMSRSVESQLWHAVYGLYWESARGYYTVIQLFSTRSDKSPYENLIPLITLRAIRAFGHLLKWRSIRYQPAGEKLWLRLHNLYRIAENEGFHRQPLQAYAEDSAPCSCESAYLHISMLSLANTGTLYPKQLDLLDRWLKGWHAQLQLDRRMNADVPSFVVDLSADHGPRRARKPDLNKPMRFWTTSALLQKLDELTAALHAGSTPEQLGLTESARTPESLELLKHLQLSWSSLASREQRRAPRAAMKRMFDVAHGLSAIINQLKVVDAPANVSPYGSGLNYSEADDVQVYGFITDRTRERVSQMQAPVTQRSPDVESWVMHDESECGFGAIIESRDKDWLRVGALVCLKSHESSQWHLGIVRRLSRVNNDSSSVGIETFAEIPALVMLYDPPTPSAYTVDGVDLNSASQPHASLWLDSGDDKGSVIIDPVHFMPGRTFLIHHASEPKKIALGTPIDHSEGWIRVMTKPCVEPVSA